MDNEYICNIYVALINKGLKIINDVPSELQNTVLTILNNR